MLDAKDIPFSASPSAGPFTTANATLSCYASLLRSGPVRTPVRSFVACDSSFRISNETVSEACP
jgi:hypothetical protein